MSSIHQMWNKIRATNTGSLIFSHIVRFFVSTCRADFGTVLSNRQQRVPIVGTQNENVLISSLTHCSKTGLHNSCYIACSFLSLIILVKNKICGLIYCEFPEDLWVNILWISAFSCCHLKPIFSRWICWLESKRKKKLSNVIGVRKKLAFPLTIMLPNFVFASSRASKLA